MKEVTRIRIAEVSYDIEIAAKKKLESYIDALSAYAEDDNVLEDIEIRITELLDERGILVNGVISLDDVDAIRTILGEPKYFLGEGDMAIGPDGDWDIQARRKLYRDIDGAVLGGVVSGVAQFFKINPLWLRLIFIVLLLVSFGTIALLYLVLWLAIPAAKSVTEKLQMQGEPVTLGNIRKHNESYIGTVSTKDRLQRRRKVFSGAIGIVGALVSLSAVTAIGIAIVTWLTYMPKIMEFTDQAWLIFGLVISSGILLAILGILISYSGLAVKMTRKIIISGVVVIVLGILTASTAAGIVGYESWQRQQAIQESIKERGVALPSNFTEVKRLIVDVENANIDYRVSEDVRATIVSVPGVSAEIVQNDSTATVSLKAARIKDMDVYRPTIIIYGPQLNTLDIQSGSTQYTAKTQQLELVVASNAFVTLYGNYTQLQVSVKEASVLSAEGASVKDIGIAMESGSSISLGNINTLNVTQPTACPNNAKAELQVQSIGAGSLVYNGMELPKTMQETSCGILRIGEVYSDYGEYGAN